MGMIVTEINELRKLLARFRDGEITREDLSAEISVYKQVDNRAKSALTFVSLLIRAGLKREAKRALRGNLLGDTEEVNDELPLYDRTADRGSE
jgi:hypothetical protein